MRASISSRRKGGIGCDKAALDAFGENALAVDAAPVILERDDDATAALIGGEGDGAFARLAGGLAFRRGFKPVIHGVAQHMRQRISEFLDDGLVDLGRFARDDKAHLLAKGCREFAGEARHALKNGPHRLGADRHDRILQGARLAQQGLQALMQPGADVGRELFRYARSASTG